MNADLIVYLQGRVSEMETTKATTRFRSLTGYLALQTSIRELEQRIVELQISDLQQVIQRTDTRH